MTHALNELDLLGAIPHALRLLVRRPTASMRMT